ncbi:MAG: hypothetical protein GDA43_20280 [Hormoscilla sp. SP5CHS1]|nr:hypothetical protein [Hormoscilla sp. SP12CHS1]MBC6455246.1 hypothetical protein [Hormoscilla sp. SP5CHS1]
MDTKTLAAVGYSYAEVKQNYGGIEQRWLVVESQKRREADLNNLEKKIKKELSVIERKLKDLSKQDFTCKPDASSDSIPHNAQAVEEPRGVLVSIKATKAEKAFPKMHLQRKAPSKKAACVQYHS